MLSWTGVHASEHTPVTFRGLCLPLRSPANCAQPMTYYASLVLVLLGLKIVMVILLVLPLVWTKLVNSNLGILYVRVAIVAL